MYLCFDVEYDWSMISLLKTRSTWISDQLDLYLVLLYVVAGISIILKTTEIHEIFAS